MSENMAEVSPYLRDNTGITFRAHPFGRSDRGRGGETAGPPAQYSG